VPYSDPFPHAQSGIVAPIRLGLREHSVQVGRQG